MSDCAERFVETEGKKKRQDNEKLEKFVNSLAQAIFFVAPGLIKEYNM